jgi:hypothetical protein
MVWLLVLWTARISHDGFDDKVQICDKKFGRKRFKDPGHLEVD